MKKKIFLRRIFHRGRQRLAIFFNRDDYDDNLKSVIKSIPFATYSSTFRCWYTDDTEDLLKLILKSFKDVVEVDISELTSDVYSEGRKKDEPELVVPEIQTRSPESKAQSGINRDSSYVILPEVKTGGRMVKRSRAGAVEFRINEINGSLVIRLPVPYQSEWVDELKSYRGTRYDKRRKEWLIPWSKLTCDSLADFFSEAGVIVDIKKDIVDESVREERKRLGAQIREQPLSSKALDGLDSMAMYIDENRYSPRTRETYLSMLEFFFRYFSGRDPVEISNEEISRFIFEIIIKNGYSSAYQNQMISAIRTYYISMGRENPDINLPGRPRRARALPKTFSREEVVRILNSSGNIKHKLLLWIIYSCGLRRSEVTNIRLSDLDRDRSLIHIREGKGMVDRIVPVSDKVWHKIDEYLAGYNPQEYLFEGQTKGRYSSESVYRVFKSALKKAGIRKEVGVHSLRHSYATHLHESGLDIRYIQELLGHKNTRTTEIYTHVSRRNLVSIRSPIEDLDVK